MDDTAHLLFQAYLIKLVVKIQVRALLPCCDKTTKVDDMAHHLCRYKKLDGMAHQLLRLLLPLYAVTTPQRWMIRPTYIANESIMTM